MSSVGDQIRMDRLLNALQGKDISNLTIIFGTCKDCINHGINKEHKDIDGARYCSSFHTYTGYDFCCADYEKRGNENEID